MSHIRGPIFQALFALGEFPGGEEPDASVPLQNSDDMVEDDIPSRDGNMVGPSIGAETTSDVTSSGSIKLADLQRILSNIGPAGLGLGDILKPDLIVPLVETLALEQQLSSYLPEGRWTPEDLGELLQSPPFRQQVLRTGQIDLTQFGIDPSKYKFTVLSFLEALEDSVSKSAESEELRSQTCNQNDPLDEGQ
ncbi:unnamed protein product [Ilex paraguariensis]|uniref:RPN13 DEUBAD domain-containing protein n=1 Tax=Ilex paraguariensis TaxID=185542 RepID=A0ABC8T397_9AQUA